MRVPFVSVSPLLGRVYGYRNRGDQWTAVVRAWVMPVMTGAGVTKYLGVQTRWAVLAWVGLALLVEGCAILIGRWSYRSGATEADHQLLLDADPFRRLSVERATEIRDELRALNAWTRRGA